MKRLTIYLKEVEKVNNKIYNVLSFKVKNETEIMHHLSMNQDNVKKYQTSFLN